MKIIRFLRIARKRIKMVFRRDRILFSYQMIILMTQNWEQGTQNIYFENIWPFLMGFKLIFLFINFTNTQVKSKLL